MNEENNLPDDPEETDYSPEEEQELKSTMPPAQAAVFALVAVFFLYQIGGSILTLIIFGFDLKNADVNALRLLTAGGQVLLILAPTLIFAKLVYSDVTKVLRVKMPNKREVLAFVIGFAILTPLLQNYLALQNYAVESIAESSSIINTIKEFLDTINKLVEDTYGEMLRTTNIIEVMLVVFVVSIVPAVSEELFFRGFVQKSFEQKYRPWLAVFITSLVFGLYHFNPYGLIALVALGIYLGFAAYMSESIIIPMLIHFLNNFLAITAFLLFGSDEFMNDPTIEAAELSSYVTSFLLLLVVFLLFIYFIKKYYQSHINPGRFQ